MRNKRYYTLKSAQRRLEVETTLTNYPDLPADRIVDLLYWFKREATPKEIATMARNPAISENYRHFRDTHLDRMTTGGAILATGLGIVLIVAAAVAAAFS